MTSFQSDYTSETGTVATKVHTTYRLWDWPLMDASRHVGIWTGVKVFLLLHIFQSPNYRAHIFIQPNKTNEISSHVLRSTKCFILSSLLKQQHKALAFQLKPSGAITKVPKYIFALQLLPVCPQLPGLG